MMEMRRTRDRMKQEDPYPDQFNLQTHDDGEPDNDTSEYPETYLAV